MKIEEVKNIPVINVMDSARAPAKKDKPKRAIIVLSVFFLSFFGSIAYLLIRNQFGGQISALITKLRFPEVKESTRATNDKNI